MKKILLVIILTIGLIIVVGIYSSYILLTPIQSLTTFAWENDRYLWGAGNQGTIRLDIHQRSIDRRYSQLQGIDQFLVTKDGSIWASGQSIWRYEDDKWVKRGMSTGIEHRKINDIIQTSDETIWIATWSGFKIWDETQQIWKMTPINKPARTLVEDHNETLWFGLTQDGIIEKRVEGEMIHWQTSNGLIDNRIKSLFIAENQDVWVGTYNGISRWNGENWQNWYDLGSPDEDGLIVSQFYETKDGHIWAATSQDLARWDGKNWTTYRRNPFCHLTWSLTETDDGTLWVGCFTGLFRWTGSDWFKYGPDQGIANNSFAHLIPENNGAFFVHTNRGLYRFNVKQNFWEPFP